MATVKELKAQAKERKIKGFSTMKKAELEAALGIQAKVKTAPQKKKAVKAKKEKKKSKYYDETLEAGRAIKKAGYSPFDLNPRRTATEAWNQLPKEEQKKYPDRGRQWRVEYADKMLKALAPIFKKYAEQTGTSDSHGGGINARNTYSRDLVSKAGPRDEL